MANDLSLSRTSVSCELPQTRTLFTEEELACTQPRRHSSAPHTLITAEESRPAALPALQQRFFDELVSKIEAFMKTETFFSDEKDRMRRTKRQLTQTVSRTLPTLFTSADGLRGTWQKVQGPRLSMPTHYPILNGTDGTRCNWRAVPKSPHRLFHIHLRQHPGRGALEMRFPLKKIAGGGGEKRIKELLCVNSEKADRRVRMLVPKKWGIKEFKRRTLAQIEGQRTLLSEEVYAAIKAEISSIRALNKGTIFSLIQRLSADVSAATAKIINQIIDDLKTIDKKHDQLVFEVEVINFLIRNGVPNLPLFERLGDEEETGFTTESCVCDMNDYLCSAWQAQPDPSYFQTISTLARHLIHTVAGTHRCGIVHLDIKPENILLTRSGFPLLTDFGLSAKQGEKIPSKGSVGKLAPEMLVFKETTAEFATDMWGLGLLFYMALKGKNPLHAIQHELHKNYRNGNVHNFRANRLLVSIILTEMREELSQEDQFEWLVARLLSEDPGNRPIAEEAKAEIDEILAPLQQATHTHKNMKKRSGKVKGLERTLHACTLEAK